MVAVRIWWSSLVAADRDLLDLLDPTERARVRSLERPADQGRSLVGAALLRVAAGEELAVPAGAVVVDRTCEECGRPHGRPRVRAPGRDDAAGAGVPPGAVGPHVSVSHSGLLVVVAVSPAAPVGVDVQRVADVPGPAVDADRAAAEWVRREAVVKVGPARSGGPPAARPAHRPAVRGLLPPLDGYVAALAALSERPPADDELDVRHWPAQGGASRRPAGG